LRGEFDQNTSTDPGYAQKDSHMRNMEKEAYLQGNMCFRDWEDTLEDKDIYKLKLAESKFLKESKTMTTRITKEFLREMIEKQLKKAIEEEQSGAFAPSHYCIHHGGVQHEGRIVTAEAVQHVEPDENGFISHYDMMLEDGTILEDISASDIQVTSASLAEAHHARGDKHKPMKKKVKETEEVDGEVVEEEEKAKEGEKAKKDSKFPDHSGDGRITQKDVLMAKGVIPKPSKKEKPDTKSESNTIDEIERDRVVERFPAIVKAAIEKLDATRSADLNAMIENPADSIATLAAYAGGEDAKLFKNDRETEEAIRTAAQKMLNARTGAKLEESSTVQTPEQENALYEQRFTPKNNRLFEKLLKEWAK
jgi:hypothetical protein